MAARLFFFSMVILLIFGGGVLLGRYSTDHGVPLLPTNLPATPENYLEQLNASPIPYGFAEGSPTPLPTYWGFLRDGKVLYDTYCGHCHGYTGAGEPGGPNPNIPDVLGFRRVPRHDSQGKTWMIPDQLLIEVIKKGTQNPMTRFVMPSFADFLTDWEIKLVIDYIKEWWTEDQRAQQRAVTLRLQIAREGRLFGG